MLLDTTAPTDNAPAIDRFKRLLLPAALCLLFSLPLLGLVADNNETSYGKAIHQPAPDFQMYRMDGTPVTLDTLNGKFVFLMFGYLSCSDICHRQSDLFKELSHFVDTPDNVMFVYISLDPERDTQNGLTAYFDSYADNFLSLRQPDIKNLQNISMAYRHYFYKDQIQDNHYAIEHNGFFYLIDPAGIIRRMYSPAHNNINSILTDLNAVQRQSINRSLQWISSKLSPYNEKTHY